MEKIWKEESDHATILERISILCYIFKHKQIFISVFAPNRF